MNSNRSLNWQDFCKVRKIKEVTDSSVKTEKLEKIKTFKERFNTG